LAPLGYNCPAKIGKSSRTTSKALSNDAQFNYNSNLEAILNEMQKEEKKRRKKRRLIRDLENIEEKNCS